MMSAEIKVEFDLDDIEVDDNFLNDCDLPVQDSLEIGDSDEPHPGENPETETFEENILLPPDLTPTTSGGSHTESPQLLADTATSQLPPKYANMSLSEFTKEMGANIQEIVQESLGLFQKDPREYHPFYLRIFKYVMIGQRLGYLSNEEGAVIKEIWREFFQFAKTSSEAAVLQPVTYTGERSPYATYLLTKKVVINGAVVTPLRDFNARKRKFRKLEATAKRLKNEWVRDHGAGLELKDDVPTVVNFFKECKAITFPGDTLIMNKIWSKFLCSGGDKPSRDKVVKDISSEMNPDTGEDPSGIKAETVKVEVSSNTSSRCRRTRQISSNNSTLPLSAKVKVKRRKLVATAAKKAIPLKMRLQKKRSKLLGFLGSRSIKLNNGSVDWRQAQVEKLLTQPRVKISTVSKIKRRKQGELSQNTQKSSRIAKKGTTAQIKVKSKQSLLQKGRKIRKTQARLHLIKTEGDNVERLNKGSIGSRKEKAGPSRRVSKLETQELNQLLDTSQDAGKDKRALEAKRLWKCDLCGGTFAAVGKLWKHKIDKHDRPPEDEATSLGIVLTAIAQCKFCPKWFLRGMSYWYHVHKEHNEKLEEWSQAEQRRLKKRTFTGAKFSRLRLDCPVCHKKATMGTLSAHLKMDHGIGENGDLWRCEACPKLVFDQRRWWLTHMKMEHGDTVNMEDIIKIAGKLNVRNDGTSLETATSPRVPPVVAPGRTSEAEPEPEHRSLIDPAGREKCDKCHQLFDPDYLPIHKEAMHSLRLPRVKCPACAETFNKGLCLWSHYCSRHLKEGDLQALDPVPAELRNSINPRAPRTRPGAPTSGGNSRFCDQCGRQFSNGLALRRHIHTIHGAGQLRENYYQCAYCPKQYKTKDILNDHTKKFHLGLNNSKCPHCSRDLQSTGKLWKHMVDIHEVSTVEAAGHCKVILINCPICSEDLLADRQFANHAKTQHPAQSAELIRTHQIKISRPRPPPAQKVKTVRESSGDTAKGEKVGEPKKDQGKCPECGEEVERGLGYHRRRMHGVFLEDGFHCPVAGCHYRSQTRTFLLKHMRSAHTGPLEEKIVAKKIIKVVEKGNLCTVYQCTLCEVYLYYYDEIKTHVVAIHPELCQELVTPPEVPCPHCSEKWGSDELVRKHIEEVHSDWCWRCPECDKVVLDADDLGKHFLEDHQNRMEGAGKISTKKQEDDLFLELKKPRQPDSAERRRGGENSKRLKDLLRKYTELAVKCEICQVETLLKNLGIHFIAAHGIKEDGDNFECEICSKKRVYRPGHRRRWLYHMHGYHEREVNMEDLVEEATKVRTRVHWSMMERKFRNTNKAKTKARRKEEERSSEDEDSTELSEEESEYDSDKDKTLRRGNRTVPKGKVGRPPVHKTVNGNSRRRMQLPTPEQVSARETNSLRLNVSGRPRDNLNVVGYSEREPRKSLTGNHRDTRAIYSNPLESERRLVIQLERLKKEQLEFWEKKRLRRSSQ